MGDYVPFQIENDIPGDHDCSEVSTQNGQGELTFFAVPATGGSLSHAVSRRLSIADRNKKIRLLCVALLIVSIAARLLLWNTSDDAPRMLLILGSNMTYASERRYNYDEDLPSGSFSFDTPAVLSFYDYNRTLYWRRFNFETIAVLGGVDALICLLDPSGGLVLFQYGKFGWELTTHDTSLKDLKKVAANLIVAASESNWEAAMPNTTVFRSEGDDMIDQILMDVPLPDGFIKPRMQSRVIDMYDLQAYVLGNVLCGWFTRWFDARASGDSEKESTALTALQSSHEWIARKPIFASNQAITEIYFRLVDRLTSDSAAMLRFEEVKIPIFAVSRNTVNCIAA